MLNELKAIRESILDENRWTRNYFALDDSGKPVGTNDKTAVRFCLVGAILKTVSPFSHKYLLIYHNLRKNIGLSTSLYEFNDERGHKAVIDLLDKAIKQCEEENARNH